MGGKGDWRCTLDGPAARYCFAYNILAILLCIIFYVIVRAFFTIQSGLDRPLYVPSNEYNLNELMRAVGL